MVLKVKSSSFVAGFIDMIEVVWGLECPHTSYTFK